MKIIILDYVIINFINAVNYYDVLVIVSIISMWPYRSMCVFKYISTNSIKKAHIVYVNEC